VTSTPSWRRSCAASARAIPNDVVSSRALGGASREGSAHRVGEEPRVEHDGVVVVSARAARRRADSVRWICAVGGDTAPLPRGYPNATVEGRHGPRRRSVVAPSPRSDDTVGSPAPWMRDVQCGTRARSGPPAVRSPTVRTRPPRERARSPAHLSRPGHLLPPGVRHRRASWAGPGSGRRCAPRAQRSARALPRGAARPAVRPGRVGAAQREVESSSARAAACAPRERRPHSSWVGCRGSSSPVIGAALANAVIRTAGRL
jgi:hypothetical protein